MKRGTPMKRTPMQRKAPLRAAGPAVATVKVKKPKTVRCKAPGCRESFEPLSPWQILCTGSVECATAWAEKGIAKKVAAAAKKKRQEDREHRAKLDNSKPLQHWLKLTEGVVNHFIQTRDKGLPCISCGTRRTVQWEAGHFLSVGARPELRFDPNNINLQCHRCNVQLSGNQAAYRIGLVDKRGEAVVQELEGPHPTAHFTREILAAIRKQFAADTRALKKAA